MQKAKHVVIVAGEESGDAHAAELIKALKAKHPETRFSGIGGRHMQAAGAEMIYDLASYGVTGLTEVLKQFKYIKQAFRAIQNHLKQEKPDLLILVDYPGFNLRLAEYAKQTLGLRILYYISPQIWAWKAGRIKKIKANIDRMAVIFPFEKNLYEKAQVPVDFVGHPLVSKLDPSHLNPKSKSDLGLPSDKTIIALLPGSRRHEIQHHLPVFKQTMEKAQSQYEQLHFVIPIAGTIKTAMIEEELKDLDSSTYTLIQGQAIDVLCNADFVIVASGTASLECALLEKPMCIIYQSSFISYLIASQVIQTRYLGLCNILSDQMLVPELLQYDFNANALLELIDKFLSDAPFVSKMKDNLQQLRKNLSSNQADCSLLELVEREMQ